MLLMCIECELVDRAGHERPAFEFLSKLHVISEKKLFSTSQRFEDVINFYVFTKPIGEHLKNEFNTNFTEHCAIS